MSAIFPVLASDGYESYFGKLKVRKVGKETGANDRITLAFLFRLVH